MVAVSVLAVVENALLVLPEEGAVLPPEVLLVPGGVLVGEARRFPAGQVHRGRGLFVVADR